MGMQLELVEICLSEPAGNMADSLDSISAAASNFLESGDPQRALELYGEAVAMATAAGMKSELSSILGEMAVAYRRIGDVPAAVETNRRAIDLARDCADDLNVARWSGNLGGLLFLRNEIDRAEDCFREAVEAAARTGSREQMSIAAGHLAGMMGERGRFSEAVRIMTQAREYAEAVQGLTAIIRDQELDLFLRWAYSLREEGRLREAREVINRALATLVGTPPTKEEVLLLVLLGDVEEREGDIVSACEALERGAAASEANGDREEASRLRELGRRMRG
jgi:tetratricopeptide (TPR) repeat protein